MAEELKIVIGADVDDAKRGINSVTDVLQDFGRQGKLSIGVVEEAMKQLKAVIKQTSNPEDLKKLNGALDELQRKLNSLKIQGGLEQQLNGVSRSTRIAHTELDGIANSLKNLASGSERGLEGITNLVFSFENLSGLTGGLGNAFTALGESLLGPAGIVLGITTLLPTIIDLGKELFNSEDAIKKNEEAFDNLNKKLAESKKAFGDLETKINFLDRIGPINLDIQFGKGFKADILDVNAKVLEFNEKILAQQKVLTDAQETRLAAQKLVDDEETTAKKKKLESDKKLLEQAKKNEEDAIAQLNALQQSREVLFAQGRALAKQHEQEIANSSTAIPEQELANMKAFIERVKAAQKDLGKDFVIPIDQRLLDDTLRGFDDTAKKLIAAKENLALRLKQIDVQEAAEGIDLTAEKTSIKLQIIEIDKELLKKDFESAKAFLRQQALGFKIAIPVDIPTPKLKLRVDDNDVKKSILDLSKEVNIPLKVLLDKPSLLETEDQLKQIFSSFSDTNIFTEFGKNAGQKFRDALTKAIAVLDRGFVIDPQINVDSVISSLTSGLAGIKDIQLKIIDTEDFNTAIRSLRELGAAGQAAGKAVEQAFIDAGGSSEDAAKVGDAITKSFHGLTKQAEDIARTLDSTLTPAFTDLFKAVFEGKNPVKAFFDSLLHSIEEVASKLVGAQIEKAILNIVVTSTTAQAAINATTVATEAASAAGAAAAGVATAAAAGAAAAAAAASAAAAAAVIAAAAAKAASAATGFGNPLALLGLIGGFFAEGGEPPVGKISVVGEKGPELFIPKTPGTILSHQDSVKLLSNSVKTDSVKEYESIKEYIISEKINQALREHTARISESIKTAIAPIQVRLNDTVKIIATNNEKLTAYSYKLHEVNTSNIQSIKESFVSSSDHFSKLVNSFKVVENNKEFVKSFSRSILMGTTNSKESEKGSFTETVKYFKDQLRNNYFESFSESVKGLTSPDRSIVKEKEHSFELSTILKNFSSSVSGSSLINSDKFISSIQDKVTFFKEFTNTFSKEKASDNYFSVTKPEAGGTSRSLLHYEYKESFEKLVTSFKDQFRNNIESSVSNNTLSNILQRYENSRQESVKENGFSSSSILNRSFSRITDSFTDTKIINSFEKLKDLQTSAKLVNNFSEESFKSVTNNIFKSAFEKSFSDSSEVLKSVFKTFSDSSEKIVQGFRESNSIKEILTNFKASETFKDSVKERFNQLHENSTSEGFKESVFNSKEVFSLLRSEKTNSLNSVKTFSDSFERITSDIKNVISKIHVDKSKETVSDKSFRQLELFDNKEVHTSQSLIEKFHLSSLKLDKVIEKLSTSSVKSFNVEKIINNNFISKDSFKETFKTFSLERLQREFNIPAFAQGGAVFGPTLAILGEGFGISRSNPEFVGTASQLKGIQGGAFDVNINVDGELSFSMGKLTAALNQQTRSSLRTNGKKPF